ncbi:MAG: folylpolyglutamate synthase/dihydrofolate synthase family protein [Bacteroidota bacterium]|nr:folylpolyglutamate synthase/dihydrofolate synthase family protein [Bacteroidota bacterium]
MRQHGRYYKKLARLSQPESSYRKALDELLSLEFTGMKLGLDNIRELLAILGDPQNKFDSIHIAGSNGKGSVSSMLAAVMQSNGYKTGLYTSPHLVDFRERIRVNGELITEEYVTQFLERIWADVERLHATFFEVATALAFSYFADSGVRIAIIETGLGGRLDATNVLESPLAAVITSISLEHTAQLGNTLEAIAGEKAGIMKHGVPTIVNVRSDLKHIFTARAKELDSALVFADESLLPENYLAVKSPLAGKHQDENLRTVLATIKMLALPTDDELTISGILAVQKITGMRARLEEYAFPPVLAKGATLLLDVAHNPDAFRYLKEYFTSQGIKPIVIAGFAKDKDISAILAEIKEFASLFVAVAANSHRAMPSAELGAMAESVGLKTSVSTTADQGVSAAIAQAKAGDVLLLTGSHFVVGDFLKKLEA